MRTLIYLCIGILFGITMFKSEAASWFRIYEMFKFESFHMYGIISSALGISIILTQSIKKLKIKSFYGEKLTFNSKTKSFSRYMIGGIIFGLGWALVGVCPGPMFTLVGAGYISIFIVIIASLLGTFLYGLLKDSLPH
ncbi:MAG: YeeE/YedE thiosulfate transporter family protein [Flavobacteriaceae bacterium]|nr:YeeE/YedE thiosulfate transporter family protein [Flavobacteriaceae bacterium]